MHMLTPRLWLRTMSWVWKSSKMMSTLWAGTLTMSSALPNGLQTATVEQPCYTARDWWVPSPPNGKFIVLSCNHYMPSFCMKKNNNNTLRKWFKTFVPWFEFHSFLFKILYQIHYLMRASCNPSIIPQSSVRFQCRSGFWATNVDLGKTGITSILPYKSSSSEHWLLDL